MQAQFGLPQLGTNTMGMVEPHYDPYNTTGLGALGGGGGKWLDAAGNMIGTPRTPQEIAEAETEARNLALQNGAAQEERAINRGTEEITQSELEAKRQSGQSASAAGVSNAADMQGGLQAIGSQYTGMRANLARDVRLQREDAQRQADSSMFGRLFQYGQAGNSRAGGGGANGTQSTMAHGSTTPSERGLGGQQKQEMLNQDARARSGQGLTLGNIGNVQSGPQGQGMWDKAKAVQKLAFGF